MRKQVPGDEPQNLMKELESVKLIVEQIALNHANSSQSD